MKLVMLRDIYNLKCIYLKKGKAGNNFFVPRATIKNLKCKAQSKIF